MSTAHANITIYPKADHRDVYLMHRDIMTANQQLVATIIEWADCVEVRVVRPLNAEEHAAAMAFVGKLHGATACLVNLDATDWEYLAAHSHEGGLMVPKAEADTTKAAAPKIAPKPVQRVEDPRPTDNGRQLPRMVVLPSSRSERIQDGWLRARAAMTHDPNAPLCPSCKGVGYLNAYAKTGRNRMQMCGRCNGSGSLPLGPKEAA